MLRSKQLLPLYKGARSWIAAGAVSKTNPIDGCNKSTISGTEDSKRDQILDGNGIINSQSQISTADDSNQRPCIKHTIASAPVKKFDIFNQQSTSKTPVSKHVFHRSSAGKVGLASVEGVVSHEANQQHGKLSQPTLAVANSISSTSPERPASSLPSHSHDSITSKTVSVLEAIAVPNIPTVTDSLKSFAASSTRETSDVTPLDGLSGVSHKPERLIHFGSLDTPVVIPWAEKNGLPCRNFPDNSNAAAKPFPDSHQEAGCPSWNKPCAANSRSQQIQSTNERGQVRQFSTTQNASNPEVEATATSGVRRRGTRLGRGGGNRNFHRCPNVIGSESTASEIVERMCHILRQSRWGPQTVLSLKQFDQKLTAFHINEVLKHQREPEVALEFFDWAKNQNGYKHDVCTYTTMIGILGRARNFEACNFFLQDMRKEGCEPSVVTFNRLIHSYGRANNLDAAIKIFMEMQQVGCSPDRVTYCTLIDLYSKAGLSDMAMDLCQKILHTGFKLDTFSYSVIIHCLGKAGDLNGAYRLFREMIEQGYTPSLVTYNIVIDLHAKAGKYHVALKLYNDMQDAGFQPDKVTYCLMMEILGHSGHIDEAENMFVEMEQAGWAADPPIYGQLVDLWGKAGNASKAYGWYQKMLDSGYSPNVAVCNSLLAAYLRANMYSAATEVLASMSDWGLIPTLQTYTLLLSSCTACVQQHELNSLLELMNQSGHLAHYFVHNLLMEVEITVTRDCVSEFFSGLHLEDYESKRGFADALIEFLHTLGNKSKAGYVWEVAMEHNLYPLAVKEKAPNYWIVNLHVMSMGTALVALSRILASFRERMIKTGVVPDRIEIVTGWGKRSRVSGSSLVKLAVQNMLTGLGSPFYINHVNAGCFVGCGKPLADWLHKPHFEHMVTL